ncbi:hypothetical protein JKP88DRAFT_251594 [Tribonema minus]|uniref:Helicase ATP-binding domain-containing protein n=1 Tax=Tribonema minus TaxID=303371 RepID=A0A835ZDV4_9STRA|nr:hypothetical protein JKP88DRAFT_251594 [Tribonema minus]
MSARLATFDDSSQRKLEAIYLTWKTELEKRELEVDRAGLQLVNDKWHAVVEREMARVESSRNQILQSLSKKARDDLKARERELERNAEAELQHDVRYTSLKAGVESDKKRIQRGKKAIQAMNSRTWSELGHDWIHAVKKVFKRKVTDKPLKELADEHKLLQQSILTLEIGLQQKEEHVANLKQLTLDAAHSIFMKERLDAANATSLKLTQEVVTALNELSDLLKKSDSAIKSARASIHSHISAMNDNLADLAASVAAHADSVHTLMAQFESMNVESTYKQGSVEFMVMVTSTLQTLPRMQKPTVLESRCGLAKKSDYRKMNYDSGSDAYDAAYGSDEEDQANAGKSYPFQPEAYQQAVAHMAEPSWNMNLLLYWGPGSGKTCAILLGLQRAAQYYLRHPPHDKDGAPVEAGALILMQNTAGLEEYFGEINKFCIDKDEMKGLRVREVKRPKFSEDDDDDAPPSRTKVSSRKGRGTSTHAKSTSSSPYKNSHERCFLSKDKRVVLRVIVHKMSSPLLVAAEWRKGPIHKHQKTPAGSPRWEIPRVGCVIVDEAHNLFDTSQMKTSQHSNHAVKFIDQMLARPDIRRLLSTGTPVADSNGFSKLMTLLDFLRHPASPGADVLANAPACAQPSDSIAKGTGKMTDLDELEESSKASKIADRTAINEQLRKYAIERAVRKKWFYQLPDDDYAWMPCAEHTFKQMLYGYVSYVNMEADTTAFPQFGVQWGGSKFAKGMTYTNFRAAGFEAADSFPTASATDTPKKGARKGATIAVRKTKMATRFEFQDFEPTGKGPSMLVVDVPTHQPNLKAEESRVTVQGQIGKHITQIKDVPFKWFALRQALLMNPEVKHFVFLEKQTDDLLKKFCAWLEKSNRDDPAVAATDPMHNTQLFSLPRGYNDKWSDGQAPTSATMLNQVVRRVARRCSMSNIEPIDRWLVTIVIYHTSESQKEAACEPDCINDEGIVAGLLEYELWDEILYQLLSKSKRYTARPIPPEAAPDLIRKFPTTNKRHGADHQAVKKLEKKAKTYMHRVEADVMMHDSLEKEIKALQAIRNDVTFNLNDLQSASLRIDTAGRAAQQLVERNARYT